MMYAVIHSDTCLHRAASGKTEEDDPKDSLQVMFF